jgi:hypothetical protein
MEFGQILFYITKSLGIAYVTILQFTYAITANMIFDKYLFHEQNVNNFSLFYEFIYLCLILGTLSIFSYIGRKIIKHIPSPFHLLNKFDHSKLKELGDTSAITGFMLLTSGIIANRVDNLRKIYKIKT